MENNTLARFESISGKHWAELDYMDSEKWGRMYGYKGHQCQGGYEVGTSESDALAQLAAKVAAGHFQPDANKTPLRLVYTAPGVTLDTARAEHYAARDKARWTAFLKAMPRD